MRFLRRMLGRDTKGPVQDLAGAPRGQMTSAPAASQSSSISWDFPPSAEAIAAGKAAHMKSDLYARHRSEIERATAGQTGSDLGFTLSSMRRAPGGMGLSMTDEEHARADAHEAQQRYSAGVRAQQEQGRVEAQSAAYRESWKAAERKQAQGPFGRYDPYAASDIGHI